MKASLLTLALLAIPAFALAQSAPQVVPERAAAQSPKHAQLELAERDLAEHDSRANCLRYTGTRIVRRAPKRDVVVDRVDALDRDDCVAADGRVFSQDDLRRTGRTDIADALRALDPAIR